MKKYQLTFLRAAINDIRHSRLWYNSQKDHLGDEFLNEIDKLQNQIKSNPKKFPKVRNDIRKAVLKRFPYSIFFVVTDKKISVIAVFHNSRNPIVWQKRPK